MLHKIFSDVQTTEEPPQGWERPNQHPASAGQVSLKEIIAGVQDGHTGPVDANIGCISIKTQHHVLSEPPVTPSTHIFGDAGSTSSLGPQFQPSCLLAAPWIEGNLSLEHLIFPARDCFKPGDRHFHCIQVQHAACSPQEHQIPGNTLGTCNSLCRRRLGLPCPQVHTPGKWVTKSL